MKLKPDLLWDALACLGALLAFAGLWMAWPPLAPIVAGLTLVAVACWGARRGG